MYVGLWARTPLTHSTAFVKTVHLVQEEEDEAEDDEEVGFESIVVSFLQLDADKQEAILDSLDDEARAHLSQLAEEQQQNPLLVAQTIRENREVDGMKVRVSEERSDEPRRRFYVSLILVTSLTPMSLLQTSRTSLLICSSLRSLQLMPNTETLF